ncbi:DNA cytosine methyltransferase [Vibrio parahaemolyticus]|nr:DNA cytosine methyltransferase [Vibrio parahaemolyticus]
MNLKKLGYHVHEQEVFCPEFGIPQTRTRLVLLASLHSEVPLIEITHEPQEFVSVRDTIEHLPPIQAGEADPDDPLHRCSRLNDINLRRIQASRPRGSWKDWPMELRAKCHTKDTGKGYASVYGRMVWDAPSPTLTTQCYGFGNGRFGHPVQDRAISLREAAILQSFPSYYQFVKEGGRYEMSTLGRMIGNAVPVRLGKVVGESPILTETLFFNPIHFLAFPRVML